MTKIAIVMGSTRPGRIGEAVAQWVYDVAQRHGRADYELVDLREVGLPLVDEPVPALMAAGRHAHALRWAWTIARFDGFVFATPEYNQGMPAALKNALDFLYAEWNHTSAGFVGYGSEGASRAVAQLRQVLGGLKVADVRLQIALPLATEFIDYAEFKPQAHREEALEAMLDEIVAWADALTSVRAWLIPSAPR